MTDNRALTVAADLSESVNLEHGSIWGHYDPETNPLGTRLKAAIQEAGNVSTAIGLVSQNASVDPDKFAGVWAFSGTYGAFTPLMYLPARVWSQQNQDSQFRTGVLHILAAHSGPETAADARTHFGIFSPQVWKLFPRGHVINLSFWDYNDVAPGYFAAAEIAAREKKVGIITIEVARPDFPVADRSTFADTDLKAAAKGLYVIRDFAPGRPTSRLRRRAGRRARRSTSSTFCRSSSRPASTSKSSRRSARSCSIASRSRTGGPCCRRRRAQDLMFVTGGTRRMWPLRNVGAQADEYSLTADWDNQWLTGGLEADVIAEAHLDKESIFAGVQRFAQERAQRLDAQRSALDALTYNESGHLVI